MAELSCFVIQGFGPKTDYTDGRVLNLDASYEVIKQAVQEAGLQCVRADEIVHSGTIDVPMYERLLQADLVIADLSTYNVNAAFELGVRYALRPCTTIVIAEDQFKSPFDIAHIVIRRYKHLGEDIGAREARRFKEELVTAIRALLPAPRTDSPVYTLLPQLRPPLAPVVAPVSAPASAPTPAPAPASTAEADTAAPGSAPAPAPETAIAESLEVGVLLEIDFATDASAPRAAPLLPGSALSARDWLDRARAAVNEHRYADAIEAWSALLKLHPGDSHATQQLALATYKARQPDAESALAAARELLRPLHPGTTNNPETVALWGAIHRRLWEIAHRSEDLFQAIAAYERGFMLKQDHFNGTSLGFLLIVRALVSARAGQRNEAIADRVLAARTRRELIRQVQPLAERPDLADRHRFWFIGALWVAALALGDTAAAAAWDARADALTVEPWMQAARHRHGERLLALQAELAALLDGPPA